MPKTIRWGIIGCGDVTEKKSGPGFQKADNSELVAVMRRSADKAKDYAQRHHVPKWYDDADKLMNDPDVDAVYIATPPESHRDYTILVSQVGKPIYVEKPMARSYAECEKMISACRKSQSPLFVAYYRRSLPKFIKVKEIIEAGTIGPPRSVRIALTQMPQADLYESDTPPWRIIPEIAGAGFFFDLASHTFDLLDFYFGPISTVQGIADNQMNLYSAEDVVSSMFQFENGIIGSGIWCFSSNIREDSIVVIGERGKIAFSTFSLSPIIIDVDEKQKSIRIDHPEHIQQPHIQSIVDELLGKGKCPGDGSSAARTSWVLDQIIHDWRRSKGISFD